MMGELSTVLDLRLLGKLWRGTSGEQTPQSVRMTLGNKGALRLSLLPSFTSRWPIHMCFGVTRASSTRCFIHSSFRSDGSLLYCQRPRWPLGFGYFKGAATGHVGNKVPVNQLSEYSSENDVF